MMYHWYQWHNYYYFAQLSFLIASYLLSISTGHLWLDFGKLTKTSHLAYFILLLQLIATLMHTLPICSCITRFSWLVCFSRAGFSNHVKSQLEQWDPWRALDGRYGCDIHPCISEMSIKALKVCLGLWLSRLRLISIPNSPIGRNDKSIKTAG